MSDSIDLLEAIGRDASLRRLPPGELAHRLKEAGASDELASAAVQRDSAPLAKEFGTRVMQEPNSGHFPFREAPASPLKTPSPEDDEESEGNEPGQQAQSTTAKVH